MYITVAFTDDIAGYRSVHESTSLANKVLPVSLFQYKLSVLMYEAHGGGGLHC